MEKTTIEIDETRKLDLSIEDRRFVIEMTVNALTVGVQLNPAKAHQLLEAVSQYLVETP